MSSLFSKIIKRGCAALIALLVCVTFAAPKADAQGLPVSDVLSTIQNTLTALSSSALEEKELVWDGLFYDIGNQALQQMTSDIIDWANSGFNGKPAFVTDLSGYLRDIADDVATNFIYGDELSSLCTPFQLDVRTAIAKEYQEEQHGSFKKKTECSINDIAGGNPEAFLNGDFSAGGWSMWFEIALHPENTPLGGKIAGKVELDKRIAEEQFEALEDTRNNNGYMSQKVCANGKTDCVITTPGSLIRDQVSLALQAPMLRMIGADEMDEIIGSLFSNLANQAFQGVNGLLGLSQGGTNSGDSYLDAMRKETNGTSSGGGGNKIEQALRTETQVLELQLAIVKSLDEVSTTFLQAQEPFKGDSCWDLDFPESFSDKLDELVEEVPITVNTVVTLEEMLEAYDEDTSPKAQLQILQQLSRIQSEGLLSGRTTVIQLQNYLQNELRQEITELEEAIKDEVDSC